jgi:hypothetical protein
MKFIKTLAERVKTFVKGNGGTLPKLFVWVYASIFIGCGVVTVFGVCYEFFTKGYVNYQAVNNFIKEYFCPSIAGTFTILGVLLIDKDGDGVPDKWEEEKEDDKR